MNEQEKFFETMNHRMDLQYGLIGTIGFLHMFMTESAKISKLNVKVKKIFGIVLNSMFLVIYIMTFRAA